MQPCSERTESEVPVAKLYIAPDYFAVLGWLLLLLAAFIAMGSFYVGSGWRDSGNVRTLFGGVLTMALNPFVWLPSIPGGFLLHRSSASGVSCRCPRCNRLCIPNSGQRWEPGAGLRCPRCQQCFFFP